jgi:hypothetical protein
MLEMSKPLFNLGKIVTMDSGYCVTAGILALHDHDVFGQALIKKWGWYWPLHIPGDQIEDHFQTIKGENFFVHCTKDDGYVTKIMSTHGTLHKISSHHTQ